MNATLRNVWRRCIQANLPAAPGAMFTNLNAILSNLRATGFKGVLMVVNYYSTDYTTRPGPP